MITYSVTLILYNFYLFFLIPYLTVAKALELGISDSQVTTITGFQTGWAPLFLLYMNPFTYSDINTRNMNNFYNTAKAYIDAIKQQVKNNPDVELSPMDYRVLWIHENLTRRHNILKPSADAGISIRFQSHLNVLFHIFDMLHPTVAKKPKDVARIGVKLLHLPTGTVLPTIDQLIDMDDQTTMEFDIPFSDEFINDDWYIAVCFKNDAGSGNYSAILPFRLI